MIDTELAAKLDAIEAKVDAAYKAAESARKYLFWTGVVSIIVFVLPLIGLFFAIPAFIGNYASNTERSRVLNAFQSQLRRQTKRNAAPGRTTGALLAF